MKRKIIINKEIEVDDCIADEINNLIEEGIDTKASCCGHREGGYILVRNSNKSLKRMIDLGYEINEDFYITLMIADKENLFSRPVMASFLPKSVCKCSQSNDISKCILKKGNGMTITQILQFDPINKLNIKQLIESEEPFLISMKDVISDEIFRQERENLEEREKKLEEIRKDILEEIEEIKKRCLVCCYRKEI